MTKTIFLAPKKEGDTRVSFSVQEIALGFNVFRPYSRGMVLFEKKIVLVFFDGSSAIMDYVGSAYDFTGAKKFDIPFPKVRLRNPLSSVSFGWCDPLENGVKIVFGTEMAGAEDFWCDFDFLNREYVESGKIY